VCSCVAPDSWECSVSNCAPDPCPSSPGSGGSCSEPGLYCYYPEDGGSCYGTTCECESEGWKCNEGYFCDAGVEQGD
jgi:hypothetical protein